jgi:quinol monooxygenase YgiN
MLIITATWHAKPGQESALKNHLVEMLHAVHDLEPDCLEYTLHQGTSDPALFFFYEQYRNHSAFEFHKRTHHFKQLIERTSNLIAQPVSVQSLQIIA